MNNMRQDVENAASVFDGEYEPANEAARDAVREAIEVDGKTDLRELRLIALEACVETHLDGGDEFARIDSARALDAVARFLSLHDSGRLAKLVKSVADHVRE